MAIDKTIREAKLLAPEKSVLIGTHKARTESNIRFTSIFTRSMSYEKRRSVRQAESRVNYHQQNGNYDLINYENNLT